MYRRIGAGEGPLSRPKHAIERARQINARRQELGKDLGREPTDEELLERLEAARSRQNVETPQEIRQLDMLWRQCVTTRSVELPQAEHVEPDVLELPPISLRLEKLIEGWSLAEVAEVEGLSTAKLRDEIAAELRLFFGF